MPSGNPWWDGWAEFILGTHPVQEVDFWPQTVKRETMSGAYGLSSASENEYT